MPKIKVDTLGISELRTATGAVRVQASEAQSYVSQARSEIDMNTASSDNISYRINRLYSRLQAQYNKLGQYESALLRVNDQFMASDRSIANEAKEINYLLDRILESPYFASRETMSIDAELSETANLVDYFSNAGDGIAEYLWKVLKKAGHFGALVTMVSGITGLDGESSISDYGKAAKSAKGFFTNLYGDVRKMTKAKRIMHPSTYKASWAKRLFGTTDYYKSIGGASKSKSFSTKWYNNFQKSKAKEISKVTWAGVALDGVFNALDNYDEYKGGEISGWRAAAETVMETGVDTVVNVALTTAVAATLGATVGAPALAVAAGTIAVKSALDGVTRWVTGGEKDFTEAASDLILDTGEAIAEGIAEGAEKIGKGISSAVDKISTGWKSLVKGRASGGGGKSGGGGSSRKWGLAAIFS